MTIKIELPGKYDECLHQQVGNSEQLEEATKQALAFSLYQQGKLSLGQVSGLLNLHFDTVLGLMKQRGIYMNYSLEDLEHDLRLNDEILNNRK